MFWAGGGGAEGERHSQGNSPLRSDPMREGGGLRVGWGGGGDDFRTLRL